MLCGVDYPVKPDNDREGECRVMTEKKEVLAQEWQKKSGVYERMTEECGGAFSIIVRFDSFSVIARLDRAI